MKKIFFFSFHLFCLTLWASNIDSSSATWGNIMGTLSNQSDLQSALNAKGSGTVTSVGVSAPSIFSVSGSPVTTSGTISMSYSGTALPVANGGTGLTSAGSSGNALISNGTSWVSTSQPNRTGPVEGRLTLTSGTAITTSDVTAATTVYFTPYGGNQIALYTSGAWSVINFSEASVAVPSTTTTPFDIFGYNNSGSLSLETVNWTNDTTRATALTKQDGAYVKTGDVTRRYLGTGRTTGVSGQTEDSVTKRFLWNYYNRAMKSVQVVPAAATWTYATAAWRSAGADATFRIQLVAGVNETSADLTYSITSTSGSAGCNRQWGLCLDCTSTPTSRVAYTANGSDTTAYPSTTTQYVTFPGAGYHFMQAVEFAYTCTVQTPANLTYINGSWRS